MYKNAEDVYGVSHININYILNLIKTDNGIREIIEELRNADDKEYKAIKSKRLPMFTGGGNFIYRNGSMGNLVEYSNLLILDFDWDEPDKQTIIEFKEKLILYASQLHLYAVWLSPKKGVKAIMLHDNTNPEHHYNLFWQIKKRLFSRTPQLDTNCSDICRGCFLSYDPDIYVNKNPALTPYHFAFDPTISEPSKPSKDMAINTSSTRFFLHTPEQIEQNRIFHFSMTDKALMNRLVKTFNHIDPDYYKDGHRHKEIKRRAVIYCKDGILYDNAVWSLVGQFGNDSRAGLDNDDIKSIVSSCYRNASNDFGKERLKFINHIKTNNEKNDNNDTKSNLWC